MPRIQPPPGARDRLLIIVREDRRGLYEARLADRLVCRSRTPFLDSARRLLKAGYPPDGLLVMRHAGSEVESLTAKLGVAAQLTIKESARGRVAFAPYIPFVSAPAGGPMRKNESRATLVAGAPGHTIQSAE